MDDIHDEDDDIEEFGDYYWERRLHDDMVALADEGLRSCAERLRRKADSLDPAGCQKTTNSCQKTTNRVMTPCNHTMAGGGDGFMLEVTGGYQLVIGDDDR